MQITFKCNVYLKNYYSPKAILNRSKLKNTSHNYFRYKYLVRHLLLDRQLIKLSGQHCRKFRWFFFIIYQFDGNIFYLYNKKERKKEIAVFQD